MNADFLLSALARYPLAEPQDAVKWLYQHAYGCEHLLGDESACAERIRKETADCPPQEDTPAWENLGNGLCRLSLVSPLPRALPAARIARMMRATAESVPGNEALFTQTLAQLQALAVTHGADAPALGGARLPFTAQALKAYLAGWDGAAPSHSARYRDAYRPAYRVVLRRFADALPLLAALEPALARNGRATLVLDGDCAAGKTTLAALLAPLYGAAVLHLDDFFLPFSLRTPQRARLPGGNVHFERFGTQVLDRLPDGQPFSYGAYDCHTGQTHTVAFAPAPVTIIEGSYALHPAFAARYAALGAVRAFLTVPPEEQRLRIRHRNGDALLDRFQNEWIPLEKAYYQAYHGSWTDVLTLPSPWHTQSGRAKEGETP